MSRTAPVAGPPASAPHNQVRLLGRLSSIDARTLPSGDQVVALRVVVARGRRRAGGPTVDTIDCTVWRADLRKKVMGWQVGDTLDVQGALRRRFWRGPGGARSRYDVEVVKVSRVR